MNPSILSEALAIQAEVNALPHTSSVDAVAWVRAVPDYVTEVQSIEDPVRAERYLAVLRRIRDSLVAYSNHISTNPNDLPTFTITDIRGADPCYDPTNRLPENWSGTALDILRNESIPPADRIWVVLNTRTALFARTKSLYLARVVLPIARDYADQPAATTLNAAITLHERRVAHDEPALEEWDDVKKAARSVTKHTTTRMAWAAYWASAANSEEVAAWPTKCDFEGSPVADLAYNVSWEVAVRSDIDLAQTSPVWMELVTGLITILETS